MFDFADHREKSTEGLGHKVIWKRNPKFDHLNNDGGAIEFFDSKDFSRSNLQYSPRLPDDAKLIEIEFPEKLTELRDILTGVNAQKNVFRNMNSNGVKLHNV